MPDRAWPDLRHPSWGETRHSLHMRFQAVGKVKLAASPFLNQWWEVALYLTARGLTTGIIPWDGRSFELTFDLREDRLHLDVSDGPSTTIPLGEGSVADFYLAVGELLADAAIVVSTTAMPSEVPDPVPFTDQTEVGAYDVDAVAAWWTAILSVERVLQRFRTPFHGKSSPVHLFWGGFDLNHPRFNGKPHRLGAGADPMLRYGENEENFSVGFWAGNGADPSASLYAYMTPKPDGIESVTVRPDAAGWSSEMGELVLPYDALRAEEDPDEALLAFFNDAYEASADLARWDRAALEGDLPSPVPGYRR
ncbi:MAG: hypothetical protein H0U89_04840 [Acidimicrobiia bacterium]|nr:hypothetical protein [Acidimicrobiia bacterium]